MAAMFVESAWPGVVSWMALFMLDYALTILGARLLQKQDKIFYQGSYELNPAFQTDVDARKVVSVRFLIVLVATSAGVWAFWTYVAERGSRDELYLFLLGVLMGPVLIVLVRHARSLVLLRSAAGEGIRGHITYTRRVSIQLSGLDFGVSSLLFGVIFVITAHRFVLGVSVGLLTVALLHLPLARRRHEWREHERESA